MYLEQFGLKRPLTEGAIARQGDLYLGPAQRCMLEQLELGLTQADGVSVVTGPHGVGRTTLCYAALDGYGTCQALAWLGEAALDGGDPLEVLLSEFGVGVQHSTRSERLLLWRQFLGEMSMTDSRVFVIVDNTDAADDEMLRRLGALTCADPTGLPGAHLLLMGGSLLRGRLAQPQLAPLRQRIRSSITLEPMSAGEADSYWAHKAAAAGADLETLFAPGAVATLHRHAAGLPGLMNALCENALLAAAVAGEPQLSAELIDRVAMTLPGFTSEQPDAGTGSEVPVLTDAVDSEPADEAFVDRLLSAGAEAAPVARRVIGPAAISAAAR
jgi:general secretion pathway protein A